MTRRRGSALARVSKPNMGVSANTVVGVGHAIAAADGHVFSRAEAGRVEHANSRSVRNATLRP